MSGSRSRWLFAFLLSIGGAACGEKSAGPATTEVIAKAVKGELPKTDPRADAWQRAPELTVKLLIQDQAPPKLDKASVESLRVRALHDGKWIAFRLEWDDPSKDELVAAARFGDMVAVQIPVEKGANVPDAAMGQLGRPVRIHLFRASNQFQLESGKDPISALYPNATIDHYPAEAGGNAKQAMQLQYAPAKAAKNLVAVRRIDSPTEDLLSEGFGTLSPAKEQTSLGRGAHDGKAWRVVISRPLDQKENDALVLGTRTYAAFAVWQGSEDNVGSRKMRSGWVPLSIEVKP